VLAVIDPEFRERCLREITSLRASRRTVILVTHDLAQIRANTDRVLWMKKGRVQGMGETQLILDEYQRERSLANADVDARAESGEPGLMRTSP
jgi:ABC-type polysaccharide/polyol phosphate transport system ATPase subunit